MTAGGKRFGVIDDDLRRAMSGLEFVQGLVAGTLPLNTMAETLGYDVVEVSKGAPSGTRFVGVARVRAADGFRPTRML